MPSTANANRPNILLITSDQQHFDTLGFANPHIRTPALDRLAREGTHFTRAYCNNPTCTPSRASIITGMYPSTHGAWSLGTKLPEDVPTVGHRFVDAGYSTALIGKAHFQPLRSDPNGPGGESIECQPILRDLDFWRRFNDTHTPWYGFQHCELARNHADESHVGQHYAIWMEEKGLKNWVDYFAQPDPATGNDRAGGRRGKWDLPEAFHYTTWTGERTIAQLDRAAKEDKPFFIWSSFHDPHPPYLVPEPWASMYKPQDMPIGHIEPGELETMCPYVRKTQEARPDFSAFRDPDGHGNHGLHSHLHDPRKLQEDMATYYGMTSFMDHHIGRILDRLDALGISDHTLVVFTTDHGHFLGQHGLIAKSFMYDDCIRVPFIARWPGRIPAGKSTAALQSLVDLAPTFLAACGLTIPGIMQGTNQFDVWTGQTDKAIDHVIVEHRHQPTRLTIRTYIDDRYKLTVYRGHAWGELFDLREDPHELCNRWDDSAYSRIRCRLLFDLAQAEMKREPTRMSRIAGA